MGICEALLVWGVGKAASVLNAFVGHEIGIAYHPSHVVEPGLLRPRENGSKGTVKEHQRTTKGALGDRKGCHKSNLQCEFAWPLTGRRLGSSLAGPPCYFPRSCSFSFTRPQFFLGGVPTSESARGISLRHLRFSTPTVDPADNGPQAFLVQTLDPQQE
jgi:hypothetical protein